MDIILPKGMQFQQGAVMQFRQDAASLCTPINNRISI